MLITTYNKIIAFFVEKHGYASFSELQEHQITITQIHELEKNNILEKISRGWYWCKECGFDKPKDYKYIEISKVNPRAILCLDSACYLNGILDEEPSTVDVATARTDRKKIDCSFDINRYYFSDMGLASDVEIVNTEFGSYYYFGKEKTVKDCLNAVSKLEKDTRIALMQKYCENSSVVNRLKAYSDKL